MITRRGTHVEIIQHPDMGRMCFMDNVVQSCEADEALYHEALVHPVMASAIHPKRILIIGGGEGATLREVFKWPDVEHVTMYEWDEDVVRLFKERWPQWAKGAWSDPRLKLQHDDIFEAITQHPEKKYDVVIVDLFDYAEEDRGKWTLLFHHLANWTNGPIVLYMGMRSQPYRSLIEIASNHFRNIVPYKVFIPSFLGEGVFLLIRSTTLKFESMKALSHITKDVWRSYTVFN